MALGHTEFPLGVVTWLLGITWITWINWGVTSVTPVTLCHSLSMIPVYTTNSSEMKMPKL